MFNNITTTFKAVENILKLVSNPMRFLAFIVIVFEISFIPLILTTEGLDRTILIVFFILGISFLSFILYTKLPRFFVTNKPMDQTSLMAIPKIPRDSKYSPEILSEQERLKIQSDRHREFDLKILKRVISEKQGTINVLDIGCADGYATYSRFSKFDNIDNVIGIDKSDKLISRANVTYKNDPRFSFFSWDVCSSDFLEDISKLELKFDIIFIAYTLHHIAKRVSLLKNLKHLLNAFGTVVIRDLDDNSKLMHPHQEILDFVIDETKNVKEQSDRESARKLYSELKKAKFKNIKLYYDISDTVGLNLDQRKAFFNEVFSFRPNNLKRIVARGEKDYEEKLKILSERIDFIGSLFIDDDDFYYMENIVIAVAYNNFINT